MGAPPESCQLAARRVVCATVLPPPDLGAGDPFLAAAAGAGWFGDDRRASEGAFEPWRNSTALPHFPDRALCDA